MCMHDIATDVIPIYIKQSVVQKNLFVKVYRLHMLQWRNHEYSYLFVTIRTNHKITFMILHENLYAPQFYFYSITDEHPGRTSG